jgi:hypothetical protein
MGTLVGSGEAAGAVADWELGGCDCCVSLGDDCVSLSPAATEGVAGPLEAGATMGVEAELLLLLLPEMALTTSPAMIAKTSDPRTRREISHALERCESAIRPPTPQ